MIKTSNGIEYEDEVTIPTLLLMGLMHLIPNLVVRVPEGGMGKLKKELDEVLAEANVALRSVRNN